MTGSEKCYQEENSRGYGGMRDATLERMVRGGQLRGVTFAKTQVKKIVSSADIWRRAFKAEGMSGAKPWWEVHVWCVWWLKDTCRGGREEVTRRGVGREGRGVRSMGRVFQPGVGVLAEREGVLMQRVTWSDFCFQRTSLAAGWRARWRGWRARWRGLRLEASEGAAALTQTRDDSG